MTEQDKEDVLICLSEHPKSLTAIAREYATLTCKNPMSAVIDCLAILIQLGTEGWVLVCESNVDPNNGAPSGKWFLKAEGYCKKLDILQERKIPAPSTFADGDRQKIQ